MAYGFNQSYRFVSPSVRAVPGKPSYSARAASVILGVEVAKLRRLHQEGLLTADVPSRGCTEEELRKLHAEVRNLRAEDIIQ